MELKQKLSEQIQIKEKTGFPVLHDPIFSKNQVFSQQLQELNEQEKAINESYQELESEKEYEIEDSYAVESLVQDAYVLCNDLENEWKSIVIAVKTGDYDYNTNLKKKQKDYLRNVLGDRAWEVKDLIDKFIEDKIHDKSLFGNYEELYEQIEKAEEKTKVEARKLRSMCRYLAKTVTKKIKIEEEEIIPSIIPTSVNIPDARA